MEDGDEFLPTHIQGCDSHSRGIPARWLKNSLHVGFPRDFRGFSRFPRDSRAVVIKALLIAKFPTWIHVWLVKIHLSAEFPRNFPRESQPSQSNIHIHPPRTSAFGATCYVVSNVIRTRLRCNKSNLLWPMDMNKRMGF